MESLEDALYILLSIGISWVNDAAFGEMMSNGQE
jgi:hypothetical protein